MTATQAQLTSIDTLIKRFGQYPKDVHPYLGGDGVILLEFPNIFIGVEKDGYAHS